jgi:hypothetical protein
LKDRVKTEEADEAGALNEHRPRLRSDDIEKSASGGNKGGLLEYVARVIGLQPIFMKRRNHFLRSSPDLRSL